MTRFEFWRVHPEDLEAFARQPSTLTLVEAPAPSPTPEPTPQARKAALMTRLRALQRQGYSLQAIANRLNEEGVPTLSGKGRWQKGTVGNLLAQGEGSG